MNTIKLLIAGYDEMILNSCDRIKRYRGHKKHFGRMFFCYGLIALFCGFLTLSIMLMSLIFFAASIYGFYLARGSRKRWDELIIADEKFLADCTEARQILVNILKEYQGF